MPGGYPTFEKIKRPLGWLPTLPLEEMLTRAVAHADQRQHQLSLGPLANSR